MDQLMSELGSNARPLLAALSLFVTVTFLLRSSLAKRLWAGFEDTVFSSWQLALLGTTGFVLSLASGYTTWDGMRNFTGEPVLSGMITFGIQGVMLIVAWLIGESFATGMNMQSQRAGSNFVNPRIQSWVGAVIGLLLFVTGLTLMLQWTGQADVRQATSEALEWSKMGDKMLIFAFGLLMVALFVLYAASDLIRPYIQGSRVIVRNAMLWVMFLACMTTSVFFSFDSLFTSIFPQSERARAAELRAQNQVSGFIADIESAIASRQSSEATGLLDSEAWQEYEKNLNRIGKVASSSQGTLERYINSQIEDRRRAVKEQQERMASAQSGQAGLAQKKVSLTEEKSRLAADRPGLAAEYAEKKSDLDAKAREVDAKRVEAMAEDKGVEGTGKQGRGPVYRERMAELNLLQNAYKVAEERAKDSQKRLSATETRLAAIDRELANIDGDLAKLKGEAETAEQRINLAKDTASEDVGQRLDPSRLVPSFEHAIAEFREKPSSEQLASIQSLCGDIYTALQATPETKTQVDNLSCDPNRTSDAAANLFALQAGIKQFAATCSGGGKLAANRSTDELFAFARRCLQDSSLPSADTDALRNKINHVELARDDKAHRFVVTWNAFNDGNRLAYLALAIAIAIDSLIFMSGLFGANAVRSPLSDVPTFKARSAAQLEATINAALGPHPHETAWLTLNALRPMTYSDGFSAMCDLSVLDRPTANRIRMVLTAGADIGAVETISADPERYRVRSELREYLSSVCDKHFRTDATAKEKAQLHKLVGAALEPYPREHADIVLHTLEPIRETEGFTSIVSLAELPDPYELRVVRRVLNAGSTVGAVAPDKNVDDRYCIRPVLYETLLTILAGSQLNPQYAADRGFMIDERERSVIDGGRLNDAQAELPLEQRPQRLERPRAKLPEMSQDQIDQWSAYCRQELLGAINLDMDIVGQRLRSQAARSAIMQAYKSLLAVSYSNANLSNYLDTFQKEQGQVLDDAIQRLYQETGENQTKRQIVDLVQNRMEEDHAHYMLFPESGMITYLIEELERAAQPDDGLLQEEQALLEQLKYVRDGLNELNLADPVSWAEINQRLAPRKAQRFPGFVQKPAPRNRQD
ncbi:MAG TPA: hypothetical protein PKD49_08760 [Hyphomicrobium sp.]|nr:hypothetical protein [Hyphomicrobium sp.]